MQRVAIARAIVRIPKAFLMDEPLSNLAAKLQLRLKPSVFLRILILAYSLYMPFFRRKS